MKKNSKFEKRIRLLFKIFNNRPNHLAQFLIENEAFNSDFTNKVMTSDKLSKMRKDKKGDSDEFAFVDYDEMYDFFKDIIESENNEKQLSLELNNKLFDLLSEEKYEASAKLRDYMTRKQIKIII